MKFCVKCGCEMEDNAMFCKKCGTSCTPSEVLDPMNKNNGCNINSSENTTKRAGLKVCMAICFAFAAIFIIGMIADKSMLAGVCLFGILGIMFYVLSKTPKYASKIFINNSVGITKGWFIFICTIIAFSLFGSIINVSTTNTENVVSVEQSQAENTEETETAEDTVESKNNAPQVPAEFSEPYPVVISASLYDNIIGMPEVKCSIRNTTDKEILAVQFYFLPKDVYGEDANSVLSTNRLESDTAIAAGSTYSGSWQLLDDSVKSGDLYVYSVYFADGTEWGDRSASLSKIKDYALKTSISY